MKYYKLENILQTKKLSLGDKSTWERKMVTLHYLEYL